MPRICAAFCCAEPPRRKNPPPSTTVARYGSSSSALPSASITIMVSTAPAPKPPSSSENGRGGPLSHPPAVRVRAPRFRGDDDCCSWRPRRLQPQHRLGDDVALDLVGAAVDR